MKHEAKIADPPDEQVEAARRVLPVFAGARLLALRELSGNSQKDVAAAAGITSSALSQAERGGTTPSAINLARLALIYDVSPDAFASKPEPVFEMQLQFRHLRRTPKRERLSAHRMVDAVEEVARYLQRHVVFPEPFSFTCPLDPTRPVDEVADEIEAAALRTREALGLDQGESVGAALIDVLERAGVAVVRDSETGKDIDAYSAVVDSLPVIILDGGDGSVWDRDNFNLAHELGHLVMHREAEQAGTRTIEAQAHRFAGAFLAPREAIEPLLPRDLNWNEYLALKRTWGMSMAALARRAKDLGVINDAVYTRAMKQRSAAGWQREEPGSTDRPLPTPRLLNRAAVMAGVSAEQVARASHLPTSVVRRVLGSKRPSLLE